MKSLLIASCLVSGLVLISAIPLDKTEKKCGYESCHPVNQAKFNVHLVPHSHDDVGWLKTVDQYFYGSQSVHQFAGVQYIIGSVIQSLQLNPDRRFIQVETAFFWQWWQKQSEPTKETVRQLVNAGRLEIINGAWSMNDEAAAHYHSIIDQFTWGLRMINDTLGECGRPKIGWQIDPFGHSSEMASIFSQLGYEAMFFARLDYRDSALRHKTRTLETMWQGSQSLGNKSNLFTGVLYDFYTTPAYFCWDVLCSDVPITDDPESPDYNVDTIVNRFADYVIKGSSFYETNHLLVTMGGDFTYQAAEMFYINMDRLIAGFKKYRPEINVIYSTPSCYVKAVNEAAKKQNHFFPLKTDDFFPYASGNHSYWTGYFTSRPNSKRFERQGNNMLQVSKQLAAVSKAKKINIADDITLLKEAMGIMQHHDAITGTEKQHVADDYVRIMDKAIKRAERNLSAIIHEVLRKPQETQVSQIVFESCLLSNISYCRTSNDEEFTVAVYNPLSRNVSHYVHLPVNGSRFNITGAKGNMTYDLMPSMANFAKTHQVNASTNNLIFRADVPALGFAYFHLKRLAKNYQPQKVAQDNEHETNQKQDVNTQAVESGGYFGNNAIGVEIDAKTGKLSSVTMNNITLAIQQEFLYYRGTNGTNYGEEKRASGAYIFRPVNNTVAIPFVAKATITRTVRGVNVDEIHQEFNSSIKQIIRIYKNESFIEFDWMVGPINNINEKNPEGVEVISRFTTDLKSNSTFYTDSNGREMIERVRNHRATYTYTNEEPVSGNYYPVTSRIVIKDVARNIELALLNDRAQGGSSLKDGQVELMLHRRLLNDDAFGVGEALNELEFGHGTMARGQNYLVIGNITRKWGYQKNAASIQRDVAQKKLLAPWTFVGKINKAITLNELKSKIDFLRSGLNYQLPENIQILTLEPWKDNTILLRLEHIYAVLEHPELSKITSFSIENLFKDIRIKNALETTLGANQWIENNEKLQWNVSGQQIEANTYSEYKESDNNRFVNLKNITLGPMEIRTFICYLQ